MANTIAATGFMFLFLEGTAAWFLFLFLERWSDTGHADCQRRNGSMVYGFGTGSNGNMVYGVVSGAMV
jgi:hypothetical protein